MTGNFVLRPSEHVPIGPLQKGWVQQYQRHASVRADLARIFQGYSLCPASAKARQVVLIGFSEEFTDQPRGSRQWQSANANIFAIAAGYEDANDHQQLRHDPAFQVGAGRTPVEEQNDPSRLPLASPWTHSRFENRIDSKTIFNLHDVLIDTFLDSYSEAPEEIILDYDATDDTIHGNQKNRHFNGFYDSYCFLSLYVFCDDQLFGLLSASKQRRSGPSLCSGNETSGTKDPHKMAESKN